MRSPRSGLLCSTAAALLALVLCTASVSLGADKASEEIAVRTIYLTHPVGSIRRITISGTLGGYGTVLLDPNRCGQNLFGDTTICKSAPIPSIPVQLIRLRVKDLKGEGRRVYRVDGTLQPAGYRYYLVVPRGRTGNYRLAVVTNKSRVRVLSLEELMVKPAPAPAAPPPQTDVAKPTQAPAREKQAAKPIAAVYTPSARAECMAVQRNDKVTLTVRGGHPGPGYEARLVKTPGEYDPPVHRLVIEAPDEAMSGPPKRFEVSISFEAEGEVRFVFLFDHEGRRRIAVTQK